MRDAWARLHGRDWFRNYEDDLDGEKWASGRFSPANYNDWLNRMQGGVEGGATGFPDQSPTWAEKLSTAVDKLSESAQSIWGRFVEPLYYDRDAMGFAPLGSSADASGAFDKNDFNNWYSSNRDLSPVVTATEGVEGVVVDVGTKVTDGTREIVSAINRLGPSIGSAIASAGARFGGPANAATPSGSNATGRQR